MTNLLNYDAESGAGAIFDDTTAGLTFENTGGGPALEIKGTAVANATIAGLTLVGTSYASGAVLALKNASSFISATTINIGAAAANTCGSIRIVLPNGQFGHIPVLDDAAVSGTAV